MGVRWIIGKGDASYRNLLVLMHSIQHNRPYFSRDVDATIRKSQPSSRFLSPKEQTIIKQLHSGLPEAEIAEQFGVQPGSMRRKINRRGERLANSVERQILVDYANRQGLRWMRIDPLVK